MLGTKQLRLFFPNLQLSEWAGTKIIGMERSRQKTNIFVKVGAKLQTLLFRQLSKPLDHSKGFILYSSQ